ncbi:MAG: hypothetical protein GY774_20560 [Planctomycetes bacterium]|nr:hypothetical protein [Planctomycetota bacterium]
MFIKFMNRRLMDAEPGEAGGTTPEPEGKQEETVSLAEFKALQESNERMQQHMNKLLDEKKAEAEKAKQAQAEKEKQEIEAAKKAQNFEDFEKRVNDNWSQKLEAKEERLSMLEMRLEGQAKQAASSGLLSKFSDEGTGSLALEKMVHVTLDDDLNPVTEYRNLSGEVITTDKDKFIEYLETNHASWMRGAESSKRVVEETRFTDKTNNGQSGYSGMSTADKVKYLSQKQG